MIKAWVGCFFVGIMFFFTGVAHAGVLLPGFPDAIGCSIGSEQFWFYLSQEEAEVATNGVLYSTFFTGASGYIVFEQADGSYVFESGDFVPCGSSEDLDFFVHYDFGGGATTSGTSTTALSTTTQMVINNPTLDMFLGMVLFFVVMWFIIWFFRRPYDTC